jgi:REP element-mobilizing transposase RayT
MSRPVRIEFPGATYHITSRGNRKQDIYRDDYDRIRFLELLAEAVRCYGWIITAYVLMSNHFHFVVRLTEANLALGMGCLKSEYARQFNRRHDFVGHLFQERYDSPLVDEENYMLEVHRYVVLNPVRAGMVHDPRDFKWSSYAATAGAMEAPSWLALDDVLSLFAPQRDTARLLYQRFVDEGIGLDRVPWDDLVGQIYLGSEAWRQRIQQRVESKLLPDEHPRVQRELGERTMTDVIRSVASGGQVDEGWIRLGRGGSLRMAAAWLGWYEARLPLRAIAAGLRLRSASHVSKLVRRCEAQQKTDAGLQKLLATSTDALHLLWKSAKAQT